MELMPKSRGFTLVELLVVISIIAILSTVGMVVYSTASKSGRVSRRIQDLKAIQTALELYYNATTPKAYPVSNTNSPPGWTAIPVALVPVYMSAIPTDPSGGTYRYASNGADYKLRASGATEMMSADYATQPNLIDPASDNGSVGGDSENPTCYTVETNGEFKAWAISSSNTGVNGTTNPACW